MNTSHDDDQNNLRYAEYVLGVLDADARADVAREIETNEEAALAVALWQQRLMPLTEGLPELPPSEDVWVRIRQRLGWNTGVHGEERRENNFWSDARLWRWLSLSGALIAAVCVILLLRAPARETGHGALMFASVRQDNGVTDWTATMDLDRKQILVIPTSPVTIPNGRSTELWLIPAGGVPISVGVFRADAASVIPLSETLLARLGQQAALAVSIEPQGGSPSGQPTGPVIAKGPVNVLSPPAGA